MAVIINAKFLPKVKVSHDLREYGFEVGGMADSGEDHTGEILLILILCAVALAVSIYAGVLAP